MSPNNSFLTVGLTALAVSGFAAADPGAPPTTAAGAPTDRVLLMSDGRLLRGEISEDGSDYVVRQNGGEIRVRRRDAERAFPSIEAIYRYKLGLIPANDSDEHLKLARWCLSHKLRAEAMAELRQVVALSPRSAQARDMLTLLEKDETRRNHPRLDPGVVQTRGEMSEPAGTVAGPAPSARPAEIDPSVLRRTRRELGGSALPAIFDLPTPVAVKRADQFARVVHPVLQAACAKCHNENQDRAFQIIQASGRRALSGDALRANLEATLTFIDPQNPSRSELLTVTLMAHGNGPNPRPIFRGSSDPRFQVLAAWVNSLRARTSTDADASVSRTGAGTPERAGEERDRGFATERGRGPSASASPAPANPAASAPRAMPDLGPAHVLPSLRYVPGRPQEGDRRALPPHGQFAVEETPPSPEEFPVPYMLGGPPPRRSVPSGPGSGGTIPMPGARPAATKAAPPLPELPPGAAEVKPSPATSKPAKPIKIDPELLEKALMNRNGGR